MSPTGYFDLGYITRTHGNDGKVYVKFDVDDPTYYQELESVFFDMENKPVPFFIEYLRFTSNGILAKFEDIDDRETAQSYTGVKLLLTDDFLPEVPKDGYFYHELIGCTLIDQQGAENLEIGEIQLIYDQTAQILLGVLRNGKECMVPLVDEFEPHFDRESKKLFMKLPEGLIEAFDE